MWMRVPTRYRPHARTPNCRGIGQEISGADPACPEEEEQVDADAEAEADTVAGSGERKASPCSSPSSSWPQKKLSESHVEKEDGEVAALLRASPAEPLRVRGGPKGAR